MLVFVCHTSDMSTAFCDMNCMHATAMATGLSNQTGGGDVTVDLIRQWIDGRHLAVEHFLAHLPAAQMAGIPDDRRGLYPQQMLEHIAKLIHGLIHGRVDRLKIIAGRMVHVEFEHESLASSVCRVRDGPNRVRYYDAIDRGSTLLQERATNARLKRDLARAIEVGMFEPGVGFVHLVCGL